MSTRRPTSNSGAPAETGAYVEHVLGVENKLSGDVRLSCSCGNWRRASLHGFDGIAARYELFREHLIKEGIRPIGAAAGHFPSAGDVIRLTGDQYEGIAPGQLAVLDGIVGKPESGFVAVFGYKAFRGRPHSDLPTSETVLVDCSGGPCPYVHVRDLVYTGETARVSFWRWKNDLYQPAGATDYFELLGVPVWEWNAGLIRARGDVIPTGSFMGSDISMVVAQEERYRDGEVTDSGAEVFSGGEHGHD